MVSIGEARADDASSIAALHLRSATTAYADIIPAEAPAPTLETLEAEWLADILDRSNTVHVARTATDLVGAVIVGDDPTTIDGAELRRLYVAPAFWGHGVGSRLHDAVLASAAGRLASKLSLWVLEENARARRFYEARSWICVDGVTLDWPTLAVREVRYELELRTAPSPPADGS